MNHHDSIFHNKNETYYGSYLLILEKKILLFFIIVFIQQSFCANIIYLLHLNPKYFLYKT